jgi:chemotaxis protein CheD
MGQVALAANPTRLTTILGSCVAVTLYAPRRRLGILSHVVLPQSRGGDNPAKYADTAVPNMLSILQREGVGIRELTAKIAGGACMFGEGQFAHISEDNVETVVRTLDAAGVGIAGRDTGGASGRRVIFDLATGTLTVAFVGRPARIL